MRASGIGERIRHFRKEADLSQRDLARKVGVRPISAWRWETGRTTPSLWRLDDISEALGVTPAQLMRGVDETL